MLRDRMPAEGNEEEYYLDVRDDAAISPINKENHLENLVFDVEIKSIV